MIVDNRTMGVCPTCEGALEIVAADDPDMIQGVEQRCPSCDLDVPLALCHYPDGRYVGLATALDEDTCVMDGCEHGAVVRAQKAGMGVTEWFCAPCAPLHYLSAGRDAGLTLK